MSTSATEPLFEATDGGLDQTNVRYIGVAIDIGPEITQATWVIQKEDSRARTRGLHGWTLDIDRGDIPSLKIPSVISYTNKGCRVPHDGDAGLDGEIIEHARIPVYELFAPGVCPDVHNHNLSQTYIRILKDFVQMVVSKLEACNVKPLLPMDKKTTYNFSAGHREVTQDTRRIFLEVASLMGITRDHVNVTFAPNDILSKDIRENRSDVKAGDIHLIVRHLWDRIEFTTHKIKGIAAKTGLFQLEKMDHRFELMSFEELNRASWGYELRDLHARTRRADDPFPIERVRTSFDFTHYIDRAYRNARGSFIFNNSRESVPSAPVSLLNETNRPPEVTTALIQKVHDRIIFHTISIIVQRMRKDIDFLSDPKSNRACLHLRSGIYTPMMQERLLDHFRYDAVGWQFFPMRDPWESYRYIPERPAPVHLGTLADLHKLMNLWFPKEETDTPADDSISVAALPVTEISGEDMGSDVDVAKD